ncbi:LamG-like jellyroll fold domain-containing protein, partial [Nonomuraea sp. NPDC002799]
QIGFNSEQTTTPFTRTVIAGSGNSISAPSPQSLGADSYSFGSWSDGGAAGHNVVAPATATTYTATYAPTPVNTGLVAAYGMNEGTGTTVADASGKSNTGTSTNTAWSNSGKYGRALSFNGSNAYVSVPDSASLRLTTGMTLEAWLNPATAGGYRTALIKQHASGLAYALWANADNNRPYTEIATTTDQGLSGTASLPLNTWTHLTATYDGTTLRLFTNGTQTASKAVTGTLRTDTQALRIGGSSLWGEHFNGLIDDVRVYNRALTPTEIQNDMNTPIGTAGPPDTQAPTAPGSLTATGGQGSAQLAWTAATDNVGVTGYTVHRATTSGFTPSGANQVGSATGTSFTDSGVPAGTYYYKVIAFDAVNLPSPASNQATATITAPPANTGLVAAYGMNEGTGTTVADASGRSNTGTSTNATWSTSGRYGGALSFNGSNAYVSVPDSASLRLTTGMTLEAWLNPATAGGYRTALIKQHASGLAYALWANADNNRPYTEIATTTDQGLSGTASLPLNTWTHLTATYDGTTLRLFTNGTQTASKAVTGTLRTDTQALRIGGSSLWGEHFNGLIDDVRVYNRALTPTEIQNDMNAPVS